jgi:hypothetical protein
MTYNTVTFLNTRCRLQFSRYANGRLAIQLHDDRGEPFATATINVPTMPLAEDQVLIKDYGENEGLLMALEEAGVVRTTGVRCRLGYVQADVCRLLIPAPALH